MSPISIMQVEWLILSDAAQVVGQKLYLLGGGWNIFVVNTGFPLKKNLAVSVGVLVPWNDTNRKHRLHLEVTDDEGKGTLASLDGEFEVGRPPGIPAGMEQRIQVAANLPIELVGPGGYAVVARLDNGEERRTSFHALAGPALAARRSPQQGAA